MEFCNLVKSFIVTTGLSSSTCAQVLDAWHYFRDNRTRTNPIICQAYGVKKRPHQNLVGARHIELLIWGAGNNRDRNLRSAGHDLTPSEVLGGDASEAMGALAPRRAFKSEA